MQIHKFLPDAKALGIDRITFHQAKSTVDLAVRSTAKSSACPTCGCKSSRGHSRYAWRISDLPWQGMKVLITWHSRRSFCDAADCKQRIFTERCPQVADSFARRSSRLYVTLKCIAQTCGGESGARLAERLGMAVSPDTLLRVVRKSPEVELDKIRVLGIDDWAFRKGKTYGTILVDLERRRPIDLLPDRDVETVKRWLEEHPGIEVISRDRGDCYIKAATEGAPNAQQVADRFHLVRNLREAVEKLLSRNLHKLKSISRELETLARHVHMTKNVTPTLRTKCSRNGLPSAMLDCCQIDCAI